MKIKIHSFSKVLSIPILLLFGLVYYLSEYVDRSYSVLIFVPVVIAVVVYIFYGNIDHWYLKKNPVGLDDELKNWLVKYFKPYTSLSGDTKLKFETRLEWYLNGRLFQAMGSEIREVPEDIKVMIAAYGVWMSLGKKDYLIGDIDRIFLYKHHFPTPKLQTLHAVETDAEDGVIILNYELVAKALLQPESYYNVAIHAYAEAFLSVYGEIRNWQEVKGLEQVIHWKTEDVLHQTGLPEIRNVILHIHHYFVFNSRYKEVFPKEAEILFRYFNEKDK